MSVIQVRAERTYSVLIDVDYQRELQMLCKDRAKVAIIFSQSMKNQVPNFRFGDAEVIYLPIPDSEAGKSAKTLHQVWDWLGAAGLTRSDLIVGIGGGAVTDFAGFVAATWLRGIDWVAVPTTVAGMVDAAVGGKTGINSDYGKNLIGAFHSPVSVLIDASWLTSLSDRDFAAGLAEVVKTGFIRDGQILEIIQKNSLPEIRLSKAITLELITRSVQVKADVVSGDFKESFDREVLNYGHTFGHAVEVDSHFSLRHGECVAIGMSFISYLSEELGILSSDISALHRSLLEKLQLPTSYSAGQWPDLLALMKLDKKARGSSLRFVVISDIGTTQRLEDPMESALLRAYERVSQ